MILDVVRSCAVPDGRATHQHHRKRQSAGSLNCLVNRQLSRFAPVVPGQQLRGHIRRNLFAVCSNALVFSPICASFDEILRAPCEFLRVSCLHLVKKRLSVLDPLGRRELDDLFVGKRHERDRSPFGSGGITLDLDLPRFVIAHCEIRKGFFPRFSRRRRRNWQPTAHKLFVDWDRSCGYDDPGPSELAGYCPTQTFERLLKRTQCQFQLVD